MKAMDLQELLGRNIRSRREGERLTQDALAARLRAFGVQWSRAAVAQVETGRRKVSAGELLVLPLALDCAVADLLSGNPEQPVYVEGLVLPGDKVPNLLSGSVESTSADRDEVGTDVAQNAAAELGLDLGQLDLVVRAKYEGRSLEEERDKRLAEIPGAGDSRVRRGHITRQIFDELREIVPVLRRLDLDEFRDLTEWRSPEVEELSALWQSKPPAAWKGQLSKTTAVKRGASKARGASRRTNKGR